MKRKRLEAWYGTIFDLGLIEEFAIEHAFGMDPRPKLRELGQYDNALALLPNQRRTRQRVEEGAE